MPDLETKGPLHIEVKNAARGEVEAVVATLGQVDRDGDIIAHGAIAHGSKVKMSSYGHDVVFGGVPVGAGRLDVEGDRAVFRGRVFLKTSRGREIFQILQEMGEDQEWALGYHVIGESSPSSEQRKDGASRVLTKLDAFEVSPMLRSAGVGTRTLAVKCDGCEARDDAAFDAEMRREYARYVRREQKWARMLEPAHERAARLDREYTEAVKAKVEAEMALDRATSRVKSIEASRRREIEDRRVIETTLARRKRARLLKFIGPTTPVAVEHNRHALAVELAGWAARRWGLTPPKVKWFKREPGLEKAGYFCAHSPDAIWLERNLSGWELAEMAFHETSHFARRRGGLSNGEPEVEADTRALLEQYRRESRGG